MTSSDTLSEQYARRFQAAQAYRDGVWKILLKSRLQKWVGRDKDVLDLGCGWGVETAERKLKFDAVISTVAIPYAVDMLIDLPIKQVERYRALPNIGVVCVHRAQGYAPIRGTHWSDSEQSPSRRCVAEP